MEYRIFQFGTDNMIVNDTLKGFATDVNGECRNEEWFRWRFEQNPCGKAILSCAFDKESIVACVAVEKIPGVIDGQKNIFGFVGRSIRFSGIIGRNLFQFRKY